MDRVRFITHQGKQILLIDRANCSAEEVMQIAAEVLAHRDCATAQVGTHLERPHGVGAESLPKVFYQALKTFSRREFPGFKTREQALDWLVREEVC